MRVFIHFLIAFILFLRSMKFSYLCKVINNLNCKTMQASIENSIKTPFRASEFEENPLRAHDRKKKVLYFKRKTKDNEKKETTSCYLCRKKQQERTTQRVA